MESQVPENITLLILVGTLGMLILVVAIIVFILFYQKKSIMYQLELERTNRLYQEKMMDMMVDVQETERKRMADNLHDETGALLSTAKLLISKAESLSEGEVAETISYAKGLLNQSIDEIKRTVKDLSPSMLENFGLVASVKSICDKINRTDKINVRFKAEKINIELPKKSELALFRVIQEILNNAIKHAGADTIIIALEQVPGYLSVEISDNGKGFNASDKMESSTGLGLRNIESRIYLIRGTYKLNSSPKEGTRYSIKVPLNF